MKVRNRILLLASLLLLVSVGGIGNLMWQLPRIEQLQDLKAVLQVLILLGLFGAGLVFSVLELVRHEIISPIFQLAAQVDRLKERKIDGQRLELTGSRNIDLLTRALNDLLDGFQKEEDFYRIRKKLEDNVQRVNRCLLNLGDNFMENANRITALCGELLGGACALYNRLEGEVLYAAGQWHAPPDFNPRNSPYGHICYDVIRGANEILFIPDLLKTRYAETDPNVRRYGLQAYLGHPVRCGDETVGSLCVAFQQPFAPAENDKRLLSILASALSVEEKRNRAENKSAMLARAIETAHHGCLIIAEDARVLFVNDYGLAKLGLVLEKGNEKRLVDICPDKELIKNATETIRITKRWIGETVFNGQDGRRFPVLVSISKLDERNAMTGADSILLFQDITVQKEMREKLLASERLAVMGRLVADVAHELNNPLAIIIGGTQLILKQLAEKEPELQNQLERILRNGKRCKTILANLLGYGMTIAKKSELVNIQELIHEAIDSVSFQYDMSGIESALNCDKLCNVNVAGNRAALLSVFINLARNARQAMGSKGKLTINLGRQDDDLIRVEISDTGIGMSKEQMENLFKPFVSGWQESEGSGLGLAASLGIIETHGGKMTAFSNGIGQGATFVVTLPYSLKEDDMAR